MIFILWNIRIDPTFLIIIKSDHCDMTNSWKETVSDSCLLTVSTCHDEMCMWVILIDPAGVIICSASASLLTLRVAACCMQSADLSSLTRILNTASILNTTRSGCWRLDTSGPAHNCPLTLIWHINWSWLVVGSALGSWLAQGDKPPTVSFKVTVLALKNWTFFWHPGSL